jgi:hypothetical protein
MLAPLMDFRIHLARSFELCLGPLTYRNFCGDLMLACQRRSRLPINCCKKWSGRQQRRQLQAPVRRLT